MSSVIFCEWISISATTTFAPLLATADAVAINVLEGTITSSSFPISSASSASSRAAVPFVTVNA